MFYSSPGAEAGQSKSMTGGHIMSERNVVTFADYVEEQKKKAKDGGQILQALEPDLPWEDVKNLVGDRILAMSIEEGEPGLGERKLRVTCVDEKDKPFRFSTEHNVLIRDLETLRGYLPCWIMIVKSTSGSGRDYFHLSKEEIPF